MRGRPARISNPVDVHVRIPADLLAAAKRPGCSDADAIRKGLQHLIRHEQPDSLEAIGIRIREVKRRISKDTEELKALRETATSKGVDDLDEFESNFFNDD